MAEAALAASARAASAAAARAAAAAAAAAAQPGSAPSGSPQAAVDDTVRRLVDMGFPQGFAQLAASAATGSMEGTLTWILRHPEMLAASQSGDPSSGTADVSSLLSRAYAASLRARAEGRGQAERPSYPEIFRDAPWQRLSGRTGGGGGEDVPVPDAEGGMESLLRELHAARDDAGESGRRGLFLGMERRALGRWTDSQSVDSADTAEAKAARAASVAVPDSRGSRAVAVVAGTASVNDHLEVRVRAHVCVSPPPCPPHVWARRRYPAAPQ